MQTIESKNVVNYVHSLVKLGTIDDCVFCLSKFEFTHNGTIYKVKPHSYGCNYKWFVFTVNDKKYCCNNVWYNSSDANVAKFNGHIISEGLDEKPTDINEITFDFLPIS